MPVRVAVDAMGGDHAPGVVVEGVLDAIAEAGDPAAVEAAVRALVPDAVWADLRARRQAFIAALR